ncbi:MAG TPA: hypothetical protein VIH83_04260 [Candidatus Bathyarchaeia archaeon]
MHDAKQRQRVVGIGGTFFRSKRPRELADWYRRHLGITIENNVAIFAWRSKRNVNRVGHTIWSLFPDDTRYFGSKRQKFMLNYRVRDLDGILAQLRRGRVRVEKKRNQSMEGLLGRLTLKETGSNSGSHLKEDTSRPRRKYSPNERALDSVGGLRQTRGTPAFPVHNTNYRCGLAFFLLLRLSSPGRTSSSHIQARSLIEDPRLLPGHSAVLTVSTARTAQRFLHGLAAGLTHKQFPNELGVRAVS